MRPPYWALFILAGLSGVGCMSGPSGERVVRGSDPGTIPIEISSPGYPVCEVCQAPAPNESRTLLRWAIGPAEDTAATDVAEEEDTIVTDRPDFTEASTTVGRGRIQVEMGYTYFLDREDGVTTEFHSYPETLFRIGMFADWFELRLAPNFGTARLSGAGGGDFTVSGATDMLIGAKLALTEQAGCLPEVAVVLQAFVPVGINEFTSNQFQPGMNWLYSWEVLPDFLAIGGSTQGNRVRDETGHDYVEFAQSATMALSLTDKLGAYSELFAFFPTSAVAPGVTPEYFYNGGFTYLLTPNLQFDVRAGVGLNGPADDFFAGSGLSFRY